MTFSCPISFISIRLEQSFSFVFHGINIFEGYRLVGGAILLFSLVLYPCPSADCMPWAVYVSLSLCPQCQHDARSTVGTHVT